MKDKYQPSRFEGQWIEIWEEEGVYKTGKPENLATSKPKQYVLSMFPYPSGAGLHVGHVRIYTGTDVLARFLRMNGYPVLHPMGWDAFGLPAENAAIKAKKNPLDLVQKNIANFKRQMKMIGFSYDWKNEFSTTDPEYYQWTQWLFIQFFKMGLLYKKEMPVYYCPSCRTGLAEEEVLPDGTHERCQKPITRKVLPQWVFQITKYADRLLEDLECLDWPKGILEMQKKWIGRSEGTEIKFKVKNSQLKVDKEKFIKVFTTRVDTLFGVTALVMAPEHWIIEEILNQKSQIGDNEKFLNSKLDEIKKYVEQAKRKLDLARTDLTKEKTGVDTGLKAIHPLTGEEIPIWVADYVLGWYGEGAVMVVPGHDERDYEFAKKFDLPIKEVIINSKLKTQSSKPKFKTQNLKKPFTDYGILVNSGEFTGLTSQEAIEKITKKLQSLNLGQKTVQYKLRDWIFSRQRYWGEPIPMVYCQRCAENKVDYWKSSKFKKDIKVGIFIDNANLFYSQRDNGWKIDIAKFKELISKEANVVFIKHFIALPKKDDPSFERNLRYIEKIKKNCEVITKPLKYIREGKRIIKKGDVDVNLVLSVVSELKNIDIVLIISGDSDYLPLINYVIRSGKKIVFAGFKKNLAWELKKSKYIILDRYKQEIILDNKKTPIRNRGVLLNLLYPSVFDLSRNNLFGWFPLPEDQLPLKLPYIDSYEPTETGQSPLSKIKEFVEVACPNCGQPAKRETDTMPNWAGSCWYFIRFAQNQKSSLIGKQGKIKYQKLEEQWQEITKNNSFLPVDWYLGGAEHAVLHLLYSRFWVKALYDLGLLDFKEPFLRLRNVGMVLAEDHRKMSKSFGNVINPDDVVSEYGADTLRLYEMFMAPFSSEIAWSTKALQGCYRFLKRVWEIYQELEVKSQKLKIEEDKELVIKLNKTIKKVTEDIKQIKFNTAIAAMMEFINAFEKTIILKNQEVKVKSLSVENAKKFLQILAPFAPFLTEEIWRRVFGEKKSIYLSSWPEAEEMVEEMVIIPVQVNGKLRGIIKVKRSKLKVQSEVERLALANEKVKKYLEEKNYQVIYVEGKILNFVTMNKKI